MKLIGSLLIIFGLVIILLIFAPVLKQEIRYQTSNLEGIKYVLEDTPESLTKNVRIITPVNKDFGMVIPKINVNARIFPEIDPANPAEYLPILKKGVAQAKGSAYPGQEGNLFLFAHSTDAFYNATAYNAVFFLIGKLNREDEIDIFYKNQKYQYLVVDKAVVAPEGLSAYVKEHTSGKTLTLQTCYPPGTTLKRLVVIARLTML